MSSIASTSPRGEPIGLNRQEVGNVLGMSAVFILTAERDAKYLFLSDSIEDVMGFKPEELIGRPCYDMFHPDEIPVLLDIHRRSLVGEETAHVTYMRLKQASGDYVNCAVEYSTVLDRSVGTITRAENGPLTIKQRLTAREVFEVHPRPDGKYTVKKWSRKRNSPSRSPSPPPEIQINLDDPWPQPSVPAKRTAYLIDRFTETSRVMYVTNDVIVNSRGLKGQPFYSIVKPSDRGLVRRHIESVKNWSPIVRTERRSGGTGYAEFHVLKIPDLPQEGQAYPQGTDESERHMPGQEFILVEGIFTGSSDALVCIINRIDRRKNKRGAAEAEAEDLDVDLGSEQDMRKASTSTDGSGSALGSGSGSGSGSAVGSASIPAGRNSGPSSSRRSPARWLGSGGSDVSASASTASTNLTDPSSSSSIAPSPSAPLSTSTSIPITPSSNPSETLAQEPSQSIHAITEEDPHIRAALPQLDVDRLERIRLAVKSRSRKLGTWAAEEAGEQRDSSVETSASREAQEDAGIDAEGLKEVAQQASETVKNVGKPAEGSGSVVA